MSSFRLNISLLLFLALAGISANNDDAIFVSETVNGCFHNKEVTHTYLPHDGSFVEGSKNISAKELEGIRQTILESTNCVRFAPKSLGITPETVSAHRSDILKAAFSDEGPPKNIPEQMKRCLEYPFIAKAAEQSLTQMDGSTTHGQFVVNLPGNPKISVSSDHLRASMLPWKVTVGNKSWETYSPEVPACLHKLADPAGDFHRLLDGAGYWNNGFWNDPILWGSAIGSRFETIEADRLYHELAGFSAASKRFKVDDARMGNINSAPYSLFLQLRERNPAIVDSAWWFNPLVGEKLKTSWDEFIAVFIACNQAAERHPWLSEWKSSGTNRTIEAHIIGTTPHDDINFDSEVVPGWQNAGLKGSPEFVLLLRRDRQWCATVYISKNEKPAIVTHGEPGDGKHWLDQLNVAAPSYLLVEPDGKHQERHMKAK